jgi:hypothetical protein
VREVDGFVDGVELAVVAHHLRAGVDVHLNDLSSCANAYCVRQPPRIRL